MKQYINLLEQDECRYHSAAITSPWLKIGASVAILALIAGVYHFVQTNTARIQEADQLQRRWREIESDVEAAKVRDEDLKRLQNAHNRLMGWTASRMDWEGKLDLIRNSIPEPRDRFQLTRLHFDEQIRGLRNTVNDAGGMTRRNRIDLSGIVVGDNVALVLDAYEITLSEAMREEDPWFVTAILDNVRPGPSRDDHEPMMSIFEFIITPHERPVEAP